MNAGYLYNLSSSPCIYLSGKIFDETDGITKDALDDK
jgi:hypothetical protein